MTIIQIVKSVRLGSTALEEFDHRATLEPFLLQVLGIVLHAVVDTSVMVIEEWSVLQVPSVMDHSSAVLLVLQGPSVQEKVIRLLLLVMTVSILVVTPLHVMSVKKGSYVRRELKEIVHQGKLAVEVLSSTAVLVTIPMVEEVPVSHVRLGSSIPRRRLRVRMIAPLVLLTW
jgi:hypothetical protein